MIWDRALKIRVSGFVLLLFGSVLLNTLTAQDLEKHRWENRILIIQTADKESMEYKRQVEEITDSIEELKERRIVLYQIFDRKYRYTDFQKPTNDESWRSFEKSKLRELKKSHPFKIVLIGLDGGIKLEQTKFLKKEDLFDLIDSMPMRKMELRNE